MTSESKINSRISLISNFIDYLEKEKIEYCLLGNLESSLLNQENDLDFYININQKKLIINLVKNFCEKKERTKKS